MNQLNNNKALARLIRNEHKHTKKIENFFNKKKKSPLRKKLKNAKLKNWKSMKMWIRIWK